MCVPAVAAAIPAALGGMSTAVAAAGLAASVFGTLQQGRATAQAAQAQSDQIAQQKVETAQLASVEEWRTRRQMRRQTRQQQATLGARGIDLGSPTALFLAQEAGKEMAFAGGAIRQNASATNRELTGQQQLLKARGQNALLTSRFSAAGQVLTKAPDLWPELLA